MATKKKEAPVVDNSTGKIKVKEKVEKQPTGNETKNNITKVKAKMTKPAEDLSKPTITKVNLDEPIKTKENETKEDNVNNEGVVTESKDAESPQKQEEVQPKAETQEDVIVEVEQQKEIQPESETQETPVLEEVTGKEIKEEVEEIADVAEEAIKENLETGKPLPENIQKLIDFMEETGGDLTDYVTLNQDYDKLDNHTLLKEYYRSTKPHLSDDEVDFVMEDTFAYDEEVDDEKEIKRKKLAMKEQVASAKQHLDSVKSIYYEDIKSGSKLTDEQQKAIDFFNRYNEESESNKKMAQVFKQKSEKVFNNEFKGFEYNVGDKRFRFNIKDVDKVKTTQKDINNFIGKFLNEDNTMSDAKGYHKGLYTAMNPDKIANHFYEQGRADALKDSIAESKNVSMDPRQSHQENVNTSGFKARVLNDDGPDFKFKIKNKNK